MEIIWKASFWLFLFASVYKPISCERDVTCVPLSKCTTILNMVERQNYSPQIMSTLRAYKCSYSARYGFHIWCPKDQDEFQMINARKPVRTDKPRRHIQLTSNRFVDNDLNDSPHSSKGFIWGGRSQQSIDKGYPRQDETTKGFIWKTTSSSHENFNYVTTESPPVHSTGKRLVKPPKPVIEDRIYFPDDDYFDTEENRSPKSNSRNADVSSSCGKPIVNGPDVSDDEFTANLGEFPWMALLEYRQGEVKKFGCAGTLISSKHVLTTAGCVDPKKLRERNLGALLQVVLGDYDTASDIDCVTRAFGQRCGDLALRMGVNSIAVHKGYRGNTGLNDLAIINLSENVEFSDFIQPICLPEKGYRLQPDQKLFTTLWNEQQNKESYIQKKSNVQLNGPQVNPLEAPGFCSSLPGSPIMLKDLTEPGTPFYLIRIDAGGVQSRSCNDKTVPSIFILGFKDWIDEVLTK